MVEKSKDLKVEEDLHEMALDNLWIHARPWNDVSAPGGLHIFSEAEGVRVTDIKGRTFIDGFSGLMYKNVGYGRKEIAEAAYEQMLKMTSPPGEHTAVPPVKLAAKLAQITPGSLSKAFFVTGGSEANETAVKMAKQYQRLSGFGNRYKIIARRGEYHGATHLAMSLGKPTGGDWADYEPLVPGIRHVSQPYCYRCPFELVYPDCSLVCAKELEKVIEFEGPEQVAAVIMTPICQSTPVIVPPQEYWPMIRATCDKHGVLLIDDEVVTGFGRTGKMFGIENFGVVPDIMTMAKGLTSGYLPLAACIANTEVARKFAGEDRETFRHVITFGGNPVSCAVALVNIDIMERERLPEKVGALGDYLKDQIQILYKHPVVGDIRGIGLMYAIELVKDRKTKEKFGKKLGLDNRFVGKLREAGLLTRVRGGAIRFIPPLTITRSEIDESIAIMDQVIGELGKEISANTP
jgi:adenosylmethionine-8-amino-7-oxononanoate aminotransferase